MIDLHVARRGTGIFDHPLLCGWLHNGLIDHPQVGKQVEAPPEIGLDSRLGQSPPSQVLTIDCRNLLVAGDRQRATIEAMVGPPHQRQAKHPRHAPLSFQHPGFRVQHVAGQWPDLQTGPARVEVNVIIAVGDLLRERPGGLLGDRPGQIPRAGSGQIESVVGHSGPQREGSFVDAGNQPDPTTNQSPRQNPVQATQCRHRLPFVAMNSPGQQHAGAGGRSDDLKTLQFDRHSLSLPA